jgi:hypothetical protein
MGWSDWYGARGKTNMLETCLTLGEWTFRTQPVFHSSACYRWFVLICHLTWCSTYEVWSGLPQLSHLKNPFPLRPLQPLSSDSPPVTTLPDIYESWSVNPKLSSVPWTRNAPTTIPWTAMRRTTKETRWSCFVYTLWNHHLSLEWTFCWMFSWEKQPGKTSI